MPLSRKNKIDGKRLHEFITIIIIPLILSLSAVIIVPINDYLLKGVFKGSLWLLGIAAIALAVMIYLFSSFISTYSGRAVQNVAGLDKKTGLKGLLRKWYLRTRRGYLDDLERNFNQMPFIYQDIHGTAALTIKDDHVAASYAYYPLSIGNHNPISYKTGSESFEQALACANSMLTSCNRILLFGHAGMGKTTFLQHSILDIINPKRAFHEFSPFSVKKQLIPIFVPLKVLDNETISPILKYITTIPFFSGRKGFRRLIKFAEEQKVVLFLDGYDEIITSKNGKNTIVKELDILFSRQSFTNPENNASFKELYRLLAHYNKIWLTSRLSYFFDSPLELMRNDNELRKNADFYESFIGESHKELNSTSEVVGSVLIKGVQEKHKLIGKLIDRYRKSNAAIAASLTTSGVFSFIENHFDLYSEEVADSPLFLTIFFFIYVKMHFDKEQPIDQKLSLKYAIEFCTDLILNDLDEQKVRNLDYSGIHQRREYPGDIKKEFIKFFSYQFYQHPELRKKNSFTRDDLLLVVHHFDEQGTGRVLASAVQKQKMVDEILRQNFFVIVTDMGDKRYYDFPHRRFKEIFTIDYFNTGENFSILLDHLTDPNFHDIILVYYANSEKNADMLVEVLIQRIMQSPVMGQLYTLLNECVSQKKTILPAVLAESFFKWLIFVVKVDSLPPALISAAQLTTGFTDMIEYQLRESINADDVFNTERVCGIYYMISREQMCAFLSQININAIDREINQVLCSFFIRRYEERITFPVLRTQFDNGYFMPLLSFLGSTETFENNATTWPHFFDGFSSRQKDIFELYVRDVLAGTNDLGAVEKVLCKLLIEKYPASTSFPLLQQTFNVKKIASLARFLSTLDMFNSTKDKSAWKKFKGYLDVQQLEAIKNIAP